jgi:hypothetical protein
MNNIPSKISQTSSELITVCNGLYEGDMMEYLYIILRHMFLPPSTFFIEQRLMLDNERYHRKLTEFLPAPFAKFLSLHLANISTKLNLSPNDNGGWEVWSRVSMPNSPSFGYLHVDNDEYRRSRFGKTVSPAYGSVLYVGPQHGISGGETAFLVRPESAKYQMFTAHARKTFSSPSFKLVSPKCGRLVIFPGSLPHAVLWTKSNAMLPRVTLLANFWERRISSVPRGVCSLAPTDYRGER